MNVNQIYLEDSLQFIKQLPDNYVNLIYIDPPFYTQKTQKTSLAQFKDSWTSIEQYINFLRLRLLEARRVLTETGSIYVHLNHRASHYLKIEMDKIFGYNNFINEIIWQYSNSSRGTKSKNLYFAKNYDSILVYKKKLNIFNPINVPKTYTIIEAKKAGFQQDEFGIWFKTAPKGDYCDQTIEEMKLQGKIYITKTGTIRIKYPLKVINNNIIEDNYIGNVWNDIPDIMHVSKHEKLNYPTQKPVKLLERIILASSNKNDLVADFFCGSGTTLYVAQQLSRNFIGCDSSIEAVTLAKFRLNLLKGTKMYINMIVGVNAKKVCCQNHPKKLIIYGKFEPLSKQGDTYKL